MSAPGSSDREAELISEERLAELLQFIAYPSRPPSIAAVIDAVAAARRAHELEQELADAHAIIAEERTPGRREDRLRRQIADQSAGLGIQAEELRQLRKAVAAEKRARAAEVEAAYREGWKTAYGDDNHYPDERWNHSAARAALASAPAEDAVAVTETEEIEVLSHSVGDLNAELLRVESRLERAEALLRQLYGVARNLHPVQHGALGDRVRAFLGADDGEGA